MPRILIFGAGGLLGSHLCAAYPKETIPVYRSQCDITEYMQVARTIQQHQPDIVVNCAGVVKKASNDARWMWRVNTDGPKNIRKVCDQRKIKMIQISTDCVFGSNIYKVTERDTPEPADEYGRSKLAGEISYFPHLTIRCSFIGFPDPGERGLLAWFWNTPSPVPGYTKVLWNGITTIALAQWIMTEGLNSFGIRHVHSPEIHNKCNILTLVNKVWELGKEIVEVPTPEMSRVLVSEYKNTQITEPLVDQLVNMREHGKLLWNFQSQLSYQ